MGAIGEDGIRIIDEATVAAAGLTERDVEQVEERERANLARAADRFRGDRPPISLEGRSVVIVDDGIATGATVRAACAVARRRYVDELVIAAPVAPIEAVERLRLVADKVMCLATSHRFVAISQFYDDFSPVLDDLVVSCLESAAARMSDGDSSPGW
jgi:predicted phosphoribosyltransferase